MKCQAKLAGVLLSVAVVISGAQSPSNDPAGRDTQARGYWVDTSGLMWAGKDNGKDVSWSKAMKYCRNLRLAGHSDWRLATIYELQDIYDASLETPGLADPGKGTAFTWLVRGDYFCQVLNGAAVATMMNAGILPGLRLASTSTMEDGSTTYSVTTAASARCVCVVPLRDVQASRFSGRLACVCACVEVHRRGQRRRPCYAWAVGWTRNPRWVAVGQPSVSLREPSWNQ